MKMFSVVGRAVSSRCASKVSLVTPTDAPTARLFLENLSNFSYITIICKLLKKCVSL